MKPHKAPVNSLNSHTLSLTRTENQRKNKDAKKKKTTTTIKKNQWKWTKMKWKFSVDTERFSWQMPVKNFVCTRAKNFCTKGKRRGFHRPHFSSTFLTPSTVPSLPLLQHLPCPNPKHLITLLLLLGGNKILNVPLNPSTGNVISASWLLSSPKNQRRCWRRGNPREERPEKFRMGDTR